MSLAQKKLSLKIKKKGRGEAESVEDVPASICGDWEIHRISDVLLLQCGPETMLQAVSVVQIAAEAAVEKSESVLHSDANSNPQAEHLSWVALSSTSSLERLGEQHLIFIRLQYSTRWLEVCKRNKPSLQAASAGPFLMT